MLFQQGSTCLNTRLEKRKLSFYIPEFLFALAALVKHQRCDYCLMLLYISLA